jgi:hypothetical protein
MQIRYVARRRQEVSGTCLREGGTPSIGRSKRGDKNRGGDITLARSVVDAHDRRRPGRSPGPRGVGKPNYAVWRSWLP